MSRSELERLIRDADLDVDLRQTMDRCQSQDELIAVAISLGYQISPMDVLQAWQGQEPADMPSVSGG
jgi:hypothetical protein